MNSQGGSADQVAITINGEPRSAPADATVASLLHHIGVQDDRVAVELDRQIVRRSEWETTQIRAGASIEIVQFVGGG
jgi:thiamine biosynthesis protein ThiS